MLLLGDALISGIRVCYWTAAWSCQESEFQNGIGIMVGLQEAMVECANVALVCL